jgi:hypothetical protein
MTDFTYNIGDTVELDFTVNVTGTSAKPALVRVVFSLPGGNQVSMPANEVGDKHKAIFHFDPYLFSDDGEIPFRIEVLIGNKLFVPIKKNVILKRVLRDLPKDEIRDIPKDEVINIPDNPFTVEKSEKIVLPKIKQNAFAEFEQSLPVPKIKPRSEVNYTERLETLRKRRDETKEEFKEDISKAIEEPIKKIDVSQEIIKLFTNIENVSIKKTDIVKEISSKLPTISDLEENVKLETKTLNEEKKSVKKVKIKSEIPFSITRQKIIMK